MSKETRNEIKKMVEEAKEKSRNSDGKIFRVRGPPGHLRIVETKKKKLQQGYKPFKLLMQQISL